MPSLFDDFERTDTRSARHGESAFHFYNRIATPGWSRVRDELERWYGLYCEDAEPEKANDLRGRFRSANPRQHLGAWWELYTHRLLRALYPQGGIVCEPEQEDVATRPDFAVSDDAGTVELFVESVTTLAGIIEEEKRNPALVAHVLDAINEIESADFRIHLEIRAFGAEQPRKREIKQPIEAWLATLDREAELARRLEHRRQPERIGFRDWEIEVEALAKGTPGTGPNDRLIGIGPGGAGFVNDTEYLRSAVLGKAQRYGALAAPFVIAVAPTSPIVHDEDIVAALLGSTVQHFDPDHPEGGEVVRLQDGALSTGADEVAGVLMGTAILPWTLATVPPTLWLNPKMPAPLCERLRLLRRVEFDDAGEPTTQEASVSLAELLELDPDWPGDVWAE